MVNFLPALYGLGIVFLAFIGDSLLVVYSVPLLAAELGTVKLALPLFTLKCVNIYIYIVHNYKYVYDPFYL